MEGGLFTETHALICRTTAAVAAQQAVSGAGGRGSAGKGEAETSGKGEEGRVVDGLLEAKCLECGSGEVGRREKRGRVV